MLTRFHDPQRRVLFGQLVRYAITGLLLTGLNIAVYHIALLFMPDRPNLAFAIGFIAALLVGYPAHSRYSFRDHGTRDNHWRSSFRFVIVSLIGFALNEFWVWWLVKYLGWPHWAPDFPILFVTPLVAFTINRKWVFE